MKRLVECVPNFSEGRKPEIIDQIARAIEAVSSAIVLDTHIDPDHNRSVITFVVEYDYAVEAAVRAVATAANLIDLRLHAGEHPRLGATDVLPFVPLGDVTIEECVQLAHKAGERIASECGIPVYFYEHAATRPDRVALEQVRSGGFELLREQIGTLQHRTPDFGPRRVHESAGATIVGARPFLIAFNINLNTPDVGIARRIASAVRGRNGGLRYLKALGFELGSRGLAQVSMNLVDFRKTSLHHAFEAVRREAERFGVGITGSEIVGLVPREAIDAAAEYFLRIENFSAGVVLEERIAAASGNRGAVNSTQEFAAQIASRSATPGGGAAAAYAATLGAALGQMIGRLTEGKDAYADVEAEVQEALEELQSLSKRLTQAVDEDAAAFRGVLEAKRQQHANHRRDVNTSVEHALKSATTIPIDVAAASIRVLELIENLAEIGNPVALSDAATGAQLAMAAIYSARYNVIVNTSQIEDEDFCREQRGRIDDLANRAKEMASRIEELFLESVQNGLAGRD